MIVVHVQVRDEDVVYARDRDAHGEDVLDAAGAEVEKEAVAVAQFDHDAGAGLVAPGREGTTADERDAHLIRPEGLTAGEVVHPGPHGWRWPVVWRELQAGAWPTAVGILGLVGARLWFGRCRRGYCRCRHASRCSAKALQHVTSIHGVRFFVVPAHHWLLVWFKVFTTQNRFLPRPKTS